MHSPVAKWKGLLKLLGPIFFIFLFIRVVDPKTTLTLLAGINIEIAATSILLFPIVNAAITFRWWFICKQLQIQVFFKNLFQVYYISWFLSALPMAGISPLSKFIYLKEAGKPASRAAISITLDKLFDITGLFFFGIFGLIYFPQIVFGDMLLWIILVGTCLCACIALVFWQKTWEIIKNLLQRYANKRLQRMGRNLESDLADFWSGFNLQSLGLIMGISIAIGLLRSLVLYLLAISLNIFVDFGLIVACRALIGIVNVIPISISGLGTRDAILLLTLPLSGVPKEAAIALGFAAFLWTLCSKFSGIVFWLKQPLPSNSIRAMKFWQNTNP